MVYHRNSINYRFEIMFLRKAMRLALLPPAAPRVISSLLRLDQKKLERHREIMLEGNMTPERWLSINTDGPDCPLAKVYSDAEARRLFESAGFEQITFQVRFFDPRHYGRLGKLFSRSAITWFGQRAGWHLVVNARKPAAGSSTA
jgi:hypothetical protein